MASLAFTTLDVFTTTKYAGNPLAVVTLPSAVTLSQSQKQTIAREFNYSETTFVHDATVDASTGLPSWRVDIFTVEEELPFAGHPTIGTAVHVLSSLPAPPSDEQQQQQQQAGVAARKGRFVFKAGVLDISLSTAGGEARASIPHNVHVHRAHDFSEERLFAWQAGLGQHFAGRQAASAAAAAAVVGIDVVSPVRGMNFVMVELPDLRALGAVSTTGFRAQAKLDQGWEEGPLMVMFYVRVGRADGKVGLRTRMVEGAFEDPATGSASCGLAALLALKEGLEGRTTFELVQGVEMGRRSEIGIELVMREGKIQTIELIGKAVEVMQGKVFYE